MSGLLPEVGQSLSDRYVVQRELGRGGAAFVFLAGDVKHSRPVALKVLRPELAAAVGTERFLREIEIAARLTHPNILPLYDSGQSGSWLYYVMPYVTGETLRDRLNREKQLPVEDALRITAQVADALAYAHGMGVLHRDIKPENVLFQAGHAVVADFGIATAISAAGGDRLTSTGIVVGTPAYMSPEQALGQAADGRSDVYALATMLYEMLASQPPFCGATAQVMFARRLTEPAPALRSERESVPEHVEAAVAKALARLPADRYATATEFARALTPAATTTPVATAVPAARASRRRPRSARIAMIAAAAGLLAVGAWFGLRPEPVPVSASRIAVLPFTVSGSGGLSFLREGIVDLLSRSLDGSADMRSVDPGTVITTLGRTGPVGVLDVGRARDVAERLGAGLYIIGSVHSLGSRLRIHALLYEQGSDPTAGAFDQAVVEGDTARLFELIDRLAADLLVRLRRGASGRLAETAAVTTHSLPALKLYLTGEQQLRAGQLDSAIARFQEAVAEDSTFALGYYRLAVAAGWAVSAGRADGHTLAGTASARALALDGRLGDRDRRLLHAYASFRRGAADEAERQYREILREYPDDLEAEFQLADLLFHYNPLRGRSVLEPKEPFDRVLAVDPGFL